MTDELKPCPFCRNTTSDHGHKDECWFNVIGKSKQEREDAWNTRPLEDALRAQLATRDALIERMVDCGDAMHKMLNAGAVNLESDVDDAQWEWDNIVCEYRASKDGGGE